MTFKPLPYVPALSDTIAIASAPPQRSAKMVTEVPSVVVMVNSTLRQGWGWTDREMFTVRIAAYVVMDGPAER